MPWIGSGAACARHLGAWIRAKLAAFGGLPLKAVQKAFTHEVFVSPAIREELLLLPDELKYKLSPDRRAKVRRWIRAILIKATEVCPTKSLDLCRDPKGNVYLSACLASKADYLITRDHDLLSIHKDLLAQNGLEHLNMLSSRKFLAVRSV